ncbi:MAG: DUF1992 domain-containing protein [Planctomycetota bacterium]|nr:DUF1992 domain-containing protein [Planctomycetota bacterium]
MSAPILNDRAIALIAERRIQEALKSGAFENLPGAGKPIPDLDQPYDELWWLKKLLKREELTGLPREAARLKAQRRLNHGGTEYTENGLADGVKR